MFRKSLFVFHSVAIPLIFMSPTQADVIVDVTQMGTDVHVQGTGDIDLTGLSFL